MLEPIEYEVGFYFPEEDRFNHNKLAGLFVGQALADNSTLLLPFTIITLMEIKTKEIPFYMTHLKSDWASMNSDQKRGVLTKVSELVHTNLAARIKWPYPFVTGIRAEASTFANSYTAIRPVNLPDGSPITKAQKGTITLAYPFSRYLFQANVS